ncbi:BTAD domain-containing putative transcriptional regulator [Jatrophihabitans fulvus]
MLHYRLLGPLAVDRDGEPLELGPPQQRAVLAVLAEAAGTVVSVDRLVDTVWGEARPANVQAGLQAHISRLRRLLRADAAAPAPVVRRGAGYALDLSRARSDVADFAALADECASAVARRAWADAVGVGAEALALWRGAFLADVADAEWVRVASAPWVERRTGVQKHLVTALLGTGDVAEALARSTVLLAERPLDEEAARLHVLSLVRAGRVPDALDTLRAVVVRLDDELGLEPGPDLRSLQTAVLRHDPSLMSWPPPAAAVSTAPVSRNPTSPGPAAPAAVAGPDVVPDAGPEVPELVGRDVELATIARAVSADVPAWVVVAGPAGIGKTRLVDEVVRGWPGPVARARCPDLDDSPPWWPVRQLLAELGEPLALPPDRDGTAAADRGSFAVVEDAVALVRRRAAEAPLAVVVDDLHWADDASLRFLGVLAETAVEPGLAVLLTTRPNGTGERLERVLDIVARRPGGRRIALSPLAAPDVARLVESVSGERPTGMEASELTDRTGGSPFAVVEYARLPRAERYGERTPDAVRTALRRRFAALPGGVHEVLRVVAVLGEPVDLRVTAAVAGRDVTEVVDALDAAADADLLQPSLDGAAYTFAHALLRDELVAEVADGRRRRWHRDAAAATAGPSPTAVLRRAAHLQAAGALADPDAVVDACRAAAELLDRQWLPASSWWAAALAAFDRGTDDPRPDTRDGIVVAYAASLAREGRGQALLDLLDAAVLDAVRAGRPAAAGRLAATLLRMSGAWPWPVFGSDPAPIMTTLQGLDHVLTADVGARARVLAVTAIGRCYDPDPAVPDDMSARAIDLAGRSGDTEVLADALLGRALTYAGVASHAVESVGLLDRLAGLEHALAGPDQVLADNIRTMAAITLARLPDAEAAWRRGVAGADVHRMVISRVQLRWFEAGLALWRGDRERAAELYAEAEHAHRRSELQQAGTFELAALAMAWDAGRLADAPAAVTTNPMVSRWLGAVVAAAGDAEGGDARLRAEVLRPEPDVWTSHGRATVLAHVVCDRGLVDVAPVLLDVLTPVQDCLAAFGQCGTVGPVALATARLARLLGDTVRARELLAAAQDLCERTGGAGAALHCRVEAALWDHAEDAAGPGATRTADALFELAREAEAGGRYGLAERARTAADPPA